MATGEDTGFDHDYLDVHFNWVAVSGPSTQLVPGIELIHLPGHTLGLQGALVELDESDPLLFVSDQLIFEDNLEHQGPGFANRDDHLWHESRRRVENIVTN